MEGNSGPRYKQLQSFCASVLAILQTQLRRPTCTLSVSLTELNNSRPNSKKITNFNSHVMSYS